MRQIKFRVWDKSENTFWNDPLKDMGENEYYNDEVSMWSVAYEAEKGDDSTFEWQQYTGLKDKNGKEIYEGDIVTIHDRYYVIRYGEYDIENYYIVEGFFPDPFEFDYLTLKNIHEISEVVGNIYENSELLSKVEREDFED